MLDSMFANGAAIFGIPAAFGTLLFAVKMILSLRDSDSSPTRKLSIDTVSAFIMGFGWTGLLAKNYLDHSLCMAMAMGYFGGFLMAYGTYWGLNHFGEDKQTRIDPSGPIPLKAEIKGSSIRLNRRFATGETASEDIARSPDRSHEPQANRVHAESHDGGNVG